MIGFRGHPIPVLDLIILDGVVNPSTHPQQIVSKFGEFPCALWVDEVLNVRRAHKMDKSSGIVKSEAAGSLSSVVGDIIWDGKEAVAMISDLRVEKLLGYVREKTKTLEQSAKKEAA
jgi:chemotaxis signal transduction protein